VDWLVVAVIVAAIGGELVAHALWWRPYFEHGVLLFKSQVPLAPDAGAMPNAEGPEREWGEGLGGALLFRALNQCEVAFREPQYEWRAFSYVPLMHGLVRRDVVGRTVLVEGRANLFTCVSAGMVLWVSAQHGGWLFVALLSAFLVVSYTLQVRRYHRIALVVAGAPVPTDEPPPSYTSRAGDYVAWVLLAALVGVAALMWFVG
jgi:hypothetical protein